MYATESFRFVIDVFFWVNYVNEFYFLRISLNPLQKKNMKRESEKAEIAIEINDYEKRK